ncbi:MAG: amino acid ABC transporter permease [Oscillospiraceae bacterium]|nr:amino acid ABC transporter permease [Oscillospiraceae bacterium]
MSGDDMNIADIFLNYYQYFLRGTRTTIVVSLVTVFLGSILGCFVALLRLSRFRPLSGFARLYITVIRGTPLLVQLYIVYYQLHFIHYPEGTFLGVELARIMPPILALSINSAAYVAEVIRAGIQAVDAGQTEAALSCGMTQGQAMRYIVMPQAIKNILPAIGNEFITMVKETSIIQYLGISDLMYNNGIVVTATYNPLPCYYISAMFYLALNVILGKGLNIFEMRLKRSER